MATRFYERHFQKSNNPQGFTFNELHEKLDKANKENLSLKTRIYLLEEDQGLLGKEDEENVYRINIDLKVRTQELLQELSEKDDVLKQALGTIHILRKHLYSTKRNLVTKFFIKTGFFRQNKRTSFSTLHIDEIFML